MNTYKQNGQVGLIVLLIVVVMLTVGVSVASRSVSELKLSRQEQESTRALDLAESGIEAALNSSMIAGSYETTVNNVKVNYKIDDEHGLTGVTVATGHTVEVALSNPGVNDNFQVSWVAGANACSSAAVEVAIFKNDGSVSRSAFKPPGCGNYQNLADATIDGSSYTTGDIGYSGSDDRFARVKILGGTNGGSTTVNVTGNLPAQVKKVTSTARLDQDGTTRTVVVRKLADSLPSIFDYVLFSGNTLCKGSTCP